VSVVNYPRLPFCPLNYLRPLLPRPLLPLRVVEFMAIWAARPTSLYRETAKRDSINGDSEVRMRLTVRLLAESKCEPSQTLKP